MEQIKRKRKQSIDIIPVLALLVLARICCPALSNIPLFSMALTFVYGATFVLFYLATKKTVKRQDFYLLVFALLYTAYISLRGLLAGKGLFPRDSFNAYIIVFLTVIYLWVKEKPLATKVLLFRFILAALLFDYVYSIVVLFFDPGASRISAATSVLEKSPYDILSAVGGFDAVYGGLSVVLILLSMRRMMNEKKVKNKITLLVLILALVFIFMAAYGTAIVLFCLALALFIAQRNKVFSVLLVAFGVALLVLHEPIGNGVMNLSAYLSYSETVSEKIEQFGYMLQTFEAAGTYAGDAGRAVRMFWSWNSFRNNPILGGLGVPGAKVGGHSEFLDLLGNFGSLSSCS